MLAWNRVILTLAGLLLGLWLALPGRAQSIKLLELAQFTTGVEQGNPTPVVVLDAINHSTTSFDGIERFYVDALSGELAHTGAFVPTDRTVIEAALKDLGLAPPFAPGSHAMIADQLQCAYVITSTIDRANIVQSRDGMYAEVQVTTKVMARVTRQPLVSFTLPDRSVPRTGQLEQNELFREALSNAASHVTWKLAELRILYATVLTSRDRGGRVVLRGGSNIGMQKKMMLITIRRGEMTGKLRITLADPDGLHAEVLEDSKGMAPGDLALPIDVQIPLIYADYIRDAPKPKTFILALLAIGGLVLLAGSR